jgi:hypothetical protein
MLVIDSYAKLPVTAAIPKMKYLYKKPYPVPKLPRSFTAHASSEPPKAMGENVSSPLNARDVHPSPARHLLLPNTTRSLCDETVGLVGPLTPLLLLLPKLRVKGKIMKLCSLLDVPF